MEKRQIWAKIRRSVEHAVLFGAVFNLEVTRHLAHMANLYRLGFWEGGINHGPERHSSEVICQPNLMSGGAVVQHALNVGEVFRYRHLCGLFVSYRIGGGNIVPRCK